MSMIPLNLLMCFWVACKPRADIVRTKMTGAAFKSQMNFVSKSGVIYGRIAQGLLLYYPATRRRVEVGSGIDYFRSPEQHENKDVSISRKVNM